MAGWVGVQSQVNLAKKAKTCPIMTVPTKKTNPKRNFLNSKLEDLPNP